MRPSSEPSVRAASPASTTDTASQSSGKTSFFVYLALSTVLVLALAGLNLVSFSDAIRMRITDSHYYLVLGDSLAYGFQPNLNFTRGFADDVARDLRSFGVVDDINYGCPTETTRTMVDGGCAGFVHHDAYTGPQLDAAVAFLTKHRGRVGPVTLEIGVNDVLSDFNSASCTVSESGPADLARMDQTLTQVILPRLLAALEVAPGLPAPNLHLLNLYNPFARQCPNAASPQDFIHVMNDHLATDAHRFNVPVVDVYSAFGGDTQTADHICDYTWYCSAEYHFDFHPTTAGYGVIARAIEQTLGFGITGSQGAIAVEEALQHGTEARLPDLMPV